MREETGRFGSKQKSREYKMVQSEDRNGKARTLFPTHAKVFGPSVLGIVSSLWLELSTLEKGENREDQFAFVDGSGWKGMAVRLES